MRLSRISDYRSYSSDNKYIYGYISHNDSIYCMNNTPRTGCLKARFEYDAFPALYNVYALNGYPVSLAISIQYSLDLRCRKPKHAVCNGTVVSGYRFLHLHQNIDLTSSQVLES